MRHSLPVFLLAAVLCAAPASAQTDVSPKGQYEMVKNWILKSAAAMPEANFSFKPTPEIRSYAALLGHVANATSMICLAPSGMKSPLMGDAEKLTTKAELTKALSDAFAACDASWAAMTPAWQTETIDFFGGKQTKAAVLAFNTSHTFEHYGNVVTYLRLKGIVPPSSGGM